jgi:hypothetical protein
MSGTVTLHAATLERIEVPIRTTADPTATAPDWSLTAPNATAPGSWTAGSWNGTWANGRATAVSPTIGAAGQLVVASGANYRAWVRVTAGGEVAVWPVGAVRVP